MNIITGWKVILSYPNGGIIGASEIYLDKETAEYIFKIKNKKNKTYARADEAPEVKFEEVNFVPLGGGFPDYGFVPIRTHDPQGAVVHLLISETKKDCVKRTALSKLDLEEKEALGITE